MNWIDPGVTAVKPGKRGLGTSVGSQINPNAIEDAMVWMRDQYLKHNDDVMNLVFNDVIKSAESRAQVARNATVNSRERGYRGRSIYDHFIENLTGRLSSTSSESQVGQLRRGTEDWAQRIINETSPHVSNIWRGVRDWVANAVPSERVGDTQHKAFTKLTEQLGEYMPFKNAAEMAERLHGAKRPPELADITGNLSKFEAALRLRMFEVIHPIMNLSGIINSAPAVIRHAQPLPGESTENFARRIGHSAQIFERADGVPIGVVDTGKLLQRAFKRAWSRESHADYEYMLGHGYITQEVAEFQRQFGSIDSKSTWRKFMTGDPTSQESGALGRLHRGGGLVGWISVLSDRSEDFSRSWGHMVGLELADFLKIPTREARHSFAHDIANKMIANYDPKNRPEIFQGALGAPIGLFQSFIWNYYQRLFRYIETGDARSAATQYALQGSLFGVTTLPGWSAVNKLFFDHSDGEQSPYDAIYERFGQGVGDVLMGGTLSSLPKLANLLPGEQGIGGIDLYSRGDTNVRLPVVNMPMFDTAHRIWTAMGAGASAFAGAHPNLTGQQVAEIFTNLITNRPMAGFIEQAFANGYDTDGVGQVVSETHGAMESLYRLMGARSLRQSKELEAFYSNKNAMELQNAKMSDLRVSVRAAMRAGDVDSIPDYFNQYVLNGGDPKYFKRWIKSNYKAAISTRAERMLNEVMDNPDKMALTERLLDAEVSVDESDLNADAYTVEKPEINLNPDMPEFMMNPAEAGNTLDAMESDNAFPSRL